MFRPILFIPAWRQKRQRQNRKVTFLTPLESREGSLLETFPTRPPRNRKESIMTGRRREGGSCFSFAREFCAKARLALKLVVFTVSVACTFLVSLFSCARHSFPTTFASRVPQCFRSHSSFKIAQLFCLVSSLRSSWLVCGRILMSFLCCQRMKKVTET